MFLPPSSNPTATVSNRLKPDVGTYQLGAWRGFKHQPGRASVSTTGGWPLYTTTKYRRGSSEPYEYAARRGAPVRRRTCSVASAQPMAVNQITGEIDRVGGIARRSYRLLPG